MKKVKRYVSCVMSVICAFVFMSNIIYGQSVYVNEKMQELLGELSENNEYFEDFLSCTTVNEFQLSDDNYDLMMYYDDDKYVGYVIWDNINDSVCEISKSCHAYDKYMQNHELLGEVEFIYNQGAYIIKNGSISIYLDEFGEEYYRENSDTQEGISTFTLIPGVVPQLQNSDNCIVAAVSNLIYYYAINGYSSLNPKNTFTAIKSDINNLFGGVYANNSVPNVIRSYVSGCNNNLSVTSNVIWDPYVSVAITEISNNRPCLVGFAAGSSYSQSVGHMTMGCGYEYCGGGVYLIGVADGHSRNVVYKTWSDTYNDCVITVRFN